MIQLRKGGAKDGGGEQKSHRAGKAEPSATPRDELCI
jgi:hypothetical protein